MKRATLLTSALAIAVVFALAKPADAMRDPGGPAGPYTDGMNLYQYVRSNPQRWLDPQGLTVVAPCSPAEAGTWHAIPIDYGLSTSNVTDPQTAETMLKLAAVIEFLALVPQSGTDLIGDAVISVMSGEAPTGGFPEGTAATILLMQQIMKTRAFVWVQVLCLRCECDSELSEYIWKQKHEAWHPCTFDFDTGGRPGERFGLDKDAVQEARDRGGSISLSKRTREDLEALKEAAKWEAWFKANEICSKSAK